MVSTVTENTFSTVYNDDYRDSDRYYRILFNGGRALQARELTQLQTILQKQLARFGSNIFKEGAAVNPGGPSINPRYEFIKLNTSSNTLPTNPNSIVGSIFTGASSSLRARVLEVVPAVGSDPATLYVQYFGNADSDGSTVLRMTPGENISDGTNTLTVQTTNTTNNPAVGRGVKFSVGRGDFFAQGHFVFVPEQSLIVSKYSSDYSGVLGFIVVEDVVTAADNSALYDNQGEVPNTSAPGADRYRIRLLATEQSLVDSDQMFIYYATIRNSQIVQQVKATDDYNKINDLLALRTKEESGNYVVRQFTLKFDEDSDAGWLIADVSPGIAYINGYRAANNLPTKIRVQKPTTTTTINNEVVAANYGSYVNVSTLLGSFDVNTCEQVNLRDATGYGGSTIGTARVRAVQEDGAVYRIYLFQISMSGNNSFRSVRSIGTSATKHVDLVLENSNAVLKDAANNDLLFALPNNRPSSLSDISLQYQRRFTATTNGSGVASLGSGLLGAGETWTNTTDWVVTVDSSGDNISSSTSITGSGSTTATISDAPTSSAISVLAYVNASAGTSRAKTLTETTITTTIDSDGAGVRFLSLGKADVFDVSRIRAVDSDGADLTSTFIFDNGQRDNFYGLGRLVVRSGRTVPTGNVFARFRYFAHGAGNFFSVNSYAIDYKDIPSHTLANQTVVPLRDVLDFRPRINDAGTGFSGTGANVSFLPQNTDLIQADVTYYQPRYDRFTVSEDGNLQFVSGDPDLLNPKFPAVADNALNLFNIRFNANTLDPSDMVVTNINNKRYTMKDIGLLERRIDRLEEFTTLSLLEVATDNIAVFDSAGLARTKAGFLADNFADHVYSLTSSNEYRASIDPRSKTLRPSTNVKDIRLIYDSDLSTNVVLKGDNIYVNYTEEAKFTQDIASRTENINPFAVVLGRTTVQLSPASDTWVETRYAPARAVDGGSRLVTTQGQLFNQWEWGWSGVNIEQLEVGDIANRSTSSSTTRAGDLRITTTTATVDRVVAEETIREIIGSRIVDVAIVPFMRSRKVHFKASGLIPYQRYFAFFDEVDVSSWVRQESFTTWAVDPSDPGNSYTNITQHPDGPTNLVSDVNGTIEGTFVVPSTDALKFRTGQRELKLLNVSTNDEGSATSIASGTFTASGTLQTVEETILSTRQVVVNRGATSTRNVTFNRRESDRDRSGRADPLAQTFFVDEQSGVFVTKVRAYFASKPDVAGGDIPVPVQLQIRPVVNGYPSSDTIVPGAVKFLSPAEVNVVSTQTNAGVLASPTDFEFDEPIFLNPFTEYAIVLLADTTDYNVYIARTEDFILGTTERRVTRQPAEGSLFKSQNGATWEPAQNEDLTYQIFVANFDVAGGTAVMENADVPLFQLDLDPFELDSGAQWATVFHPNHGFDSGDTVVFSGLDSATTYGGVLGSSIIGSRTVSYPDQSGYQVYLDSAATGSAAVGGNGVLATQNMQYNRIFPVVDTLVPEGTNISANAKFTTGKSYAGAETRFIKDTTFRSISFQQNNILQSPQMIINTTNEATQLGAGVRSLTYSVGMTTNNTYVSPVIDMQRASQLMIENVIDRQDSDRDAVGFNTPLTFVNETEPQGGSSIAKHITVPISLQEDAVGLKIIVSANRPSAADFVLYYRVATEGANINDLSWTIVQPETSIPSDENPAVFREYRYLVGGLGGALSPFTQYQIKIVMRSTSSSKVPLLKDLRVIALAD